MRISGSPYLNFLCIVFAALSGNNRIFVSMHSDKTTNQSQDSQTALLQNDAWLASQTTI